MAAKKKLKMELRFYEVPQNEYVLPILGENWIREYGWDNPLLHFHNLMEIGYCVDGEGELVLGDLTIPYSPGMLTIIPQNYPHKTISKYGTKSYWEYLFFDPKAILRDTYEGDRIFAEQIEKLVNENEQHYTVGENETLVRLVRILMDECRSRRNYSRECIRGLLLSLVMAIARQDNNPETKEENARNRGGIYRISSALEYVSKRYMENIKTEKLAACDNLSETHFRRLFVEYMNMTPVEYVNLVRIQQACELMKTTQCSMDELAERVGYTTVSTFNRNFRKVMGTSPYQYKKSSENYQGRLLNAIVSAKKGW
ncbi:MAG: AraC family transcriptional regulator [Lachnospiraceae bacterium]|nr:AraC family transcriptional regulator [Lachnospiraceae bacterium]